MGKLLFGATSEFLATVTGVQLATRLSCSIVSSYSELPDADLVEILFNGEMHISEH